MLQRRARCRLVRNVSIELFLTWSSAQGHSGTVLLIAVAPGVADKYVGRWWGVPPPTFTM